MNGEKRRERVKGVVFFMNARMRDEEALEEAKKNGMPLVRSTAGFFGSWNKANIVASLVKETELAKQFFNVEPISEEDAGKIADRVEQKIKESKLKFLSGPLIRELINAELLEESMNDSKFRVYRNIYTRVGMPVYDAYQIDIGTGFEARENANLQPNAESSHKKKADKASKEEFLLLMPPKLADAHLSGDVHIHDLEYFGTRPFCQDWDLRYFFYYGFIPDGTGMRSSVAGAAKKAEVAILHSVKALSSAQTNFAGGEGFYNYLTFLSPYFRGMEYDKIKQLMQMMFFELSVDAKEPVFVRQNGKIEMTEIGKFVDEQVKQNGFVTFGNSEVGFVNGLEVLAFDEKYNARFLPLHSVSRHRHDEELFEIKTRHGRSVAMTKYHSVFGTDETGNVVPLSVELLRVGDCVLCPTTTSLERELSSLDLAKEFSRLDSATEQKTVRATKIGRANENGSVERLGKISLANNGNLRTCQINSALQHDLFLDEIVEIRRVPPSTPYVYDLSVPPTENFVGGFGGICLHNTQQYVARGGQIVFSNIQIQPGVAKIWQDRPTVHHGKKWENETYGDYNDEVRMAFRAINEVALQGDAMGKPFHFPKLEYELSPEFFTSEYDEEWHLAHKLVAKFGTPYFDNTIPAYRGHGKGISCYQCLPEDEPIYAKIDGAEKIVDAKRLVEENWGEETYNDGAQQWALPNKEVLVQSFNESGEPEYKKITKLYKRNGNGKLVRITVSGGRQIRVSEDHPLIVLENGEKKTTSAKGIRVGNLLPVAEKLAENQSARKTIDLIDFFKNLPNADKLTVKVKLCFGPSELAKRTGASILTCKNWVHNSAIPLNQFAKIDEGNHEGLKIGVKFAKTGWIPAMLPLDSESGRLLGYYLAEGDDYTGRGVRFSFNYDEKERVEDVSRLLRSVFGTEITIAKHSQTTEKYHHTTVAVPALVLGKLFSALFGRGARNKRVPDLAFNAPAEFQKEFLAGMFFGDGSLNLERVPYVRIHLCKNERLIAGLRFLLLKHGIRTNLQRRPQSIELRISNAHYANKFLKTIGIIEQIDRQERVVEAAVSVSYAPVIKASAEKYDGDFYDWEVEDNHNFLHGDLVFSHNCCAYCFSDNPETDPQFEAKMNFEDGAHFSMGSWQVVTLNLPRAAYIANGDDAKLFETLRDRMDTTVEVFKQKKKWLDLMRKNHRIPFGMQQPLKDGKRAPMIVDFDGLSYVIGTVGFNEMAQFHTGYEMHESREAVKLNLRAVLEMEKYRKELAEKNGMILSLARTPAETAAQRLSLSDLLNPSYAEKARKVVKGDVGRGLRMVERGEKDVPVYYTNGTHVNVSAKIPLWERIKIEEKFFPVMTGGNMLHIWLGEASSNEAALYEMTKKIATQSQIGYFAYTKDLTICPDCQHVATGVRKSCEKCGSQQIKWWSRVTGYYQEVQEWNQAKMQEFRDRYRYKI